MRVQRHPWLRAGGVLLVTGVLLAGCGTPNLSPKPKSQTTHKASGTKQKGGAKKTKGGGEARKATHRTSQEHKAAAPRTGLTSPAATSQLAAARKLFAAKCATCHGPQGMGGSAPALKDPRVTQRFPRQSLLAAYIQRNMPANAPGTLTAAQANQLALYIESLNQQKAHK